MVNNINFSFTAGETRLRQAGETRLRQAGETRLQQAGERYRAMTREDQLLCLDEHTSDGEASP